MNLHKTIFTIILLIVATTLPLSAGGKSADERLRLYFDIPASIPLNQSAIREAVLHKISLGTPEPIVRQKLKEFGIGSDKLSHYYGADKDRKATILIEFDPTSFEIVKRHYGIHLTYDNEMKLKDIVVDVWLTGP